MVGRALSNLGVLRGWGAGLPEGRTSLGQRTLTTVWVLEEISSVGPLEAWGHLVGTRRSPSEESAKDLLLDCMWCAGFGVGAHQQGGLTQSCIPKKYSAKYILRKTRILGEKLIKEDGNTLVSFYRGTGV